MEYTEAESKKITDTITKLQDLKERKFCIESKDVKFGQGYESFMFKNYEFDYDIINHGKPSFNHNDPLAEYGYSIDNIRVFEYQDFDVIEKEENDLTFYVDWQEIVNFINKKLD